MKITRTALKALASLVLAFGAAQATHGQQVELNPGYIAGTVSISGTTLSSSSVSASGPNGANGSASGNSSGAYSLTVNVPNGTANFNVSAYAYSNNSYNYLTFPSQSVSVSPGATSIANFSVVPAFVNASVTVSGGTLSYAYFYSSGGNSSARGYAETSGVSLFPVMPAGSIQVYGTAYLTSGVQIALGQQTISLAAGNTANVSWSVTAPSSSGGLAGNFQLGGISPNQVYIYASGPAFKSATLSGNGPYSLSALPTGSYYLYSYAYYNNWAGYLQLPDSAFSPGRQNTVGSGTTTVNIAADAAFVTGNIRLTGSKTNADASNISLYSNGVPGTAAQNGNGYTTASAQSGAYSLLATPGRWVLGYPVLAQFYNSNPANYLQAYFYLYDAQTQSQQVTLAAGETVTRDLTYATGTIALTLRSTGGITFSSPYLNSSCVRRNASNQVVWSYSGYAYGNQQNVSEASVTMVGVEASCTVNAYASVNGSTTSFGQVTVNVVPGSNQVIDIGGPSLTVQSPPSDTVTANASITISGTATDDVSVTSVTVNGAAATLSPAAGGATVSFSADVALNPGANSIVTVATDSSGKKGTDTRTVYRDAGPPVIVSLAPADGTVTMDSNVTVGGIVTDDVEVKSIYVNGNVVTYSSTGNPADPREVTFTTTVALANGENTITVVAKDETPTQFASRTVRVTKSVMQPQEITFDVLPDRVYGIAPFPLAASASSGLEVAFSVVGACSISGGNLLALSGPGTCSVTASQGGNGQYLPAASVTRSFAITAAPVALDDAYNTNEDTVLVMGAPGVLGNDSDADTPILTAVLVSATGHGSLSFNSNGSFTYTPAAQFNGTDSFTYKVTDGVLESGNATVLITVNAVDDAPVAANDHYNTDEDTPLSIVGPGVLANDNDVDTPTLAAVLVAGPVHGTLALAADGSFVYTPAANFHGDDSFTYRATDGNADSGPTMVTIAVLPVNDVVVAENDAYATTEDGSLVVAAASGVLANDFDVDADGDLVVEVVAPPPQAAAFTLNADGSFSYVPRADFNGVDTFTYRVRDHGAYSRVAMVLVAVEAVNDPPSFDAVADQSVAEDSGTHAVALTGISPGPANETGQEVVVAAVSGNPAVVPDPVIAGTGASRALSYTPAANANGEATIVLTANDGAGGILTRSFKIVVTPVNDAPAFDAIADQSVDEDAGSQALSITGISPGPADEASQPVTLAAVSSDASIVPNPIITGEGSSRTLTYAPVADANGEVTITVTANDGEATNGTFTRTFKVRVNPVNDPPAFDAIADQAIDEDAGAQSVAITGVTPGPANEAAQGVAFTAVSSNPAIVPNPAVSGSGAARTLSYAPAANANGEVTITVVASDGQAANHSATRSFRIRVNAVNDGPTASNQTVTTDEDASVTITLSAADIDSSGLTFSVGSAGHGAVAVGATSCMAAGVGSTCTASVTYSPAANYNGADAFTFTASDGTLGAAATVSINVRPVNDAPAANNDSYSTLEDTALNAPSVLANDTDVDLGDSKAAILVSGAAHGTLVLNADGTFTYTPGADFNGSDGFAYKVRDGAGAESNVAAVSIAIAAVNDAPASVAFAVSPGAIDEDGTISLSGSFADPDVGDAHTVAIDWGDGTQSTVNLAAGTFAFAATHQYLDDNAADAYAVSVTVLDTAGASSDPASAPVAVGNLAPTIAAITGPAAPLAVGSTATIVATYSDVGTRDSHTCTFRWDDGTPDTAVSGSAGRCSASHAYATSNVFAVQVTIADDDGGVATDSFRYVVVYDADGGFVTGGGWILSPAGAYVPNAAVAGKATFGFVSKYKAGSSVPTGNTEFQFKAADLNFKSTAYEWMVISGAKVRYRGTGTINGAGSFGFELTAWDGDTPGGGGTDRFRLKIWDQNRGNAMLYDNQMGAEDGADPTTALGGGSIVIHK